ncbi:hypothetical protein NDN08_006587 [Rhodosorus marinus]|uniref:Uncharacterized protein n=1 Tax=Rhodosorus marinus TaxID=101924 RepID=A0AAV8UI72_9RHOD|nr:hypothetical protein NDN08_006587 [Rhodosorus marinus]
MDIGERKEIQRSISEYVKDERVESLDFLVRTVSNREREATVVVFDSLMYWVKSKMYLHRAQAIGLLTRLVLKSKILASLVTRSASKIVNYTVLDEKCDKKLSDEVQKFFLRWFVAYENLDDVKRAANQLATVQGMEKFVEEREKIGAEKIAIQRILIEMESRFTEIVPDFGSEGTELFQTNNPPVGHGINGQATPAVVDHDGDIEISLDLRVRNDENEPIYSALRARLRLLSTCEDSLLRMLEAADIPATVFDSLWEQLREVREKSSRFDLEEQGEEEMEWESAEDLTEVDIVREPERPPLDERIGNVENPDDLNAAIFRAVESGDIRDHLRSRRRRPVKKRPQKSTPKGRIQALLKRMGGRKK